MGLFDTLKKKRKTSQNKNLGPTFLENKVEQITNPKKLHSHEWKRGLKTESGGTFFKIKYYGQRQSKHKNLIVQTKFAPSKIYAVDVSNNEAFLLFDGCIHGYNAMFCDKYTKQQIENRSADKIYTSENGDNEF
ncbi:hypothetical protein [Psychroserpens sp. NJDZ02]|uniref:hypothetical protein n=1 Tax=Psychroserpens sp. NJDZ02 TaxID=2570561 RepID=UPI0010A7B8B1|nr:hypothetical protein [Psychroserpens sp. NJDZ02]QCE40162.1 hypothetical protein E9099_01560 [Psychroserpens sp. NJDZ02]